MCVQNLNKTSNLEDFVTFVVRPLLASASVEIQSVFFFQRRGQTPTLHHLCPAGEARFTKIKQDFFISGRRNLCLALILVFVSWVDLEGARARVNRLTAPRLFRGEFLLTFTTSTMANDFKAANNTEK